MVLFCLLFLLNFWHVYLLLNFSIYFYRLNDVFIFYFINSRSKEKKKQKDSIKELDQLPQRVKETAEHCTEEQIYNVLRDRNMDPNQAVMRLLLLQSQGHLSQKKTQN